MNQDNKNNLARVYHYDLYGKRSEKYSFLLNNTLQTVPWNELELIDPQYFFVQKDFSLKEEYDKGFNVQELFPVNSVGITTARDHFTIQNTKETVEKTIRHFVQLDIEDARTKFKLGEDAKDWSVEDAKRDVTKKPDFNKIVEILYRPFDKKFTYYTGKTKGLHCRPRENVMKHFLITIEEDETQKLGLIINRPAQGGADTFTDIFVTKTIVDQSIFSAIKRSPFICPLYVYIKNGIADEDKRPYHKQCNLNTTIIKEISQRLRLRFTEEKEESENTFAPIDILDYIYAVLHSPTYRERYKEFLKIDFPRVPYPENAEQFWKLVALGGKLRRLHLLEGVEPQDGMADYPIAGSNEVEKPQYVVETHCNASLPNGRVYINDTQYFDNVPTEAWNFYIGGYQPAQKWLKDRKGRVLNYEDIRHYQKMIVALKETEEVMNKINNK